MFLKFNLKLNKVEKNEEIFDFFSQKRILMVEGPRGTFCSIIGKLVRISQEFFSTVLLHCIHLNVFSTVLSASSGYVYLIQIKIGKDFGKLVPNVDFRQNWELVAFDLRN